MPYAALSAYTLSSTDRAHGDTPTTLQSQLQETAFLKLIGVAVMCGGNAHVHVIKSSIDDHGIALALQANASAVVARSLLLNNRSGSASD
eukprot:2161396-Rhodomonas_salina.2